MPTDEAERPKVQPFDIVQIDPAHPGIFGGSLMVVTEVRPWGVQGYVTIPNGGDAYYRCPWGTFAPTGGRAQWVSGDQTEAQDEGTEP